MKSGKIHMAGVTYPSELQELKSLIAWVKTIGVKKYPELRLLHHIPNGEKRSPWVGKKLKEMGVLKGMLDLCLPVARRGANGLYIEMKSQVGSLSADQKEIIKMLGEENFAVFVITKGWERAVEILEWYLEKEALKAA